MRCWKDFCYLIRSQLLLQLQINVSQRQVSKHCVRQSVQISVDVKLLAPEAGVVGLRCPILCFPVLETLKVKIEKGVLRSSREPFCKREIALLATKQVKPGS